MGFGTGWRVTASYGTAFKAPTFNELYYPFFGNAALRPESSRTVEAGIGPKRATVHWRLDTFTTAVRRPDRLRRRAARTQQHRARPRARGRARLGGSIGGWTFDASSSWLDPRSDSGAHAGNLLPRRARQTARIDLARSFGTLSLGVTASPRGPGSTTWPIPCAWVAMPPLTCAPNTPSRRVERPGASRQPTCSTTLSDRSLYNSRGANLASACAGGRRTEQRGIVHSGRADAQSCAQHPLRVEVDRRDATCAGAGLDVDHDVDGQHQQGA